VGDEDVGLGRLPRRHIQPGPSAPGAAPRASAGPSPEVQSFRAVP
jgi:hypothetical protein